MAGAVKGTKGAWGEECAAAYLRRRGYRILARNYSCRFGEIDIIAADRHYVVFRRGHAAPSTQDQSDRKCF